MKLIRGMKKMIQDNVIGCDRVSISESLSDFWAESWKKETAPKELGTEYSKERAQKCKAAEVGIRLTCSRDREKVISAGAEWELWRLAPDEVGGVGEG